MPDIFDQNIAELQITKEMLEKLGILNVALRTGASTTSPLRSPEERINEYGKYFRQLWKLIHEPYKE